MGSDLHTVETWVSCMSEESKRLKASFGYGRSLRKRVIFNQKVIEWKGKDERNPVPCFLESVWFLDLRWNFRVDFNGWIPTWLSYVVENCVPGISVGDSQQLIKLACSPWLLNDVFGETQDLLCLGTFKNHAQSLKSFILKCFIGLSETPLCKNDEAQVCTGKVWCSYSCQVRLAFFLVSFVETWAITIWFFSRLIYKVLPK